MTAHLQAVSKLLLDSSAPVLNRLLSLLSYCLQAVAAHDTLQTSHRVPIGLDSEPEPSEPPLLRRGRRSPTKLVAQTVADILETASELMLVREDYRTRLTSAGTEQKSKTAQQIRFNSVRKLVSPALCRNCIYGPFSVFKL